MTLNFIVSLILTGLIVGALGRLAVPGPNPIGILMTILLGIGGSVGGGLISRAIGATGWLAFVIAVLCAAGLVYLVSGRGAYGRRVSAGGRRGYF